MCHTRSSVALGSGGNRLLIVRVFPRRERVSHFGDGTSISSVWSSLLILLLTQFTPGRRKSHSLTHNRGRRSSRWVGVDFQGVVL